MGIHIENRIILIYLPIILFPSFFLFGPVIFYYTNSILYKNYDYNKRYLLLPGIVSLIHILFILIEPEIMLTDKIINQEGLHKYYTLFIESAIVIYNIFFLIPSLKKVLSYRKSYERSHSEDSSKSTNWIKLFLTFNIVFISSKIIFVLKSILRNEGLPFTPTEDIIVLTILFTVIYYLIAKPEVTPLENNIKQTDKYAKVNLPTGERKQYLQRLKKYMDNEKAFLIEGITISDLSDNLNIPQHLLSMTINIEYKKNFYNYINFQRIKYAEQLLKSPESKDDTILNIAYNSGFQSKASFYRFFKLINGITPTEFRKK